jgi:mono/diheme cytochrome c family protein
MRNTAITLLFCLIHSIVNAQSEEIPSDEPIPKFSKAVMQDPALLESGRQVWDGQCRHCHGNSAYPGKAPKLKPSSYRPEFVYDRVTNGFRKMPGWRAVFSQQQRIGVTVYIMSDTFSP